jgi:hypothetical protein
MKYSYMHRFILLLVLHILPFISNISSENGLFPRTDISCATRGNGSCVQLSGTDTVNPILHFGRMGLFAIIQCAVGLLWVHMLCTTYWPDHIYTYI